LLQSWVALALGGAGWRWNWVAGAESPKPQPLEAVNAATTNGNEAQGTCDPHRLPMGTSGWIPRQPSLKSRWLPSRGCGLGDARPTGSRAARPLESGRVCAPGQGQSRSPDSRRVLVAERITYLPSGPFECISDFQLRRSASRVARNITFAGLSLTNGRRTYPKTGRPPSPCPLPRSGGEGTWIGSQSFREHHLVAFPFQAP